MSVSNKIHFTSNNPIFVILFEITFNNFIIINFVLPYYYFIIIIFSTMYNHNYT